VLFKSTLHFAMRCISEGIQKGITRISRLACDMS
jgi:hypothetical protein